MALTAVQKEIKTLIAKIKSEPYYEGYEERKRLVSILGKNPDQAASIIRRMKQMGPDHAVPFYALLGKANKDYALKAVEYLSAQEKRAEYATDILIIAKLNPDLTKQLFETVRDWNEQLPSHTLHNEIRNFVLDKPEFGSIAIDIFKIQKNNDVTRFMEEIARKHSALAKSAIIALIDTAYLERKDSGMYDRGVWGCMHSIEEILHRNEDLAEFTLDKILRLKAPEGQEEKLDEVKAKIVDHCRIHRVNYSAERAIKFIDIVVDSGCPDQEAKILRLIPDHPGEAVQHAVQVLIKQGTDKAAKAIAQLSFHAREGITPAVAIDSILKFKNIEDVRELIVEISNKRFIETVPALLGLRKSFTEHANPQDAKIAEDIVIGAVKKATSAEANHILNQCADPRSPLAKTLAQAAEEIQQLKPVGAVIEAARAINGQVEELHGKIG